MRISDSTIDDVRLASDIVDVISTSVRLKKRGKNYLGLCPFHTEKTPSFNVSPEKQMFHCFGCGIGGNVFTFIMQLEKVPFPEAVRTLAARAGITLPEEKANAAPSVHEPLYNACRRAGMHFAENLYRSPEGKLALDYFHKRGFNDETIKKFGLGCSLNSWDDLIRHAKQEGTDPPTLDKAGLVVRRDDESGFYDRFRGRAMFPILSTSGRTIGFGARKLREDDTLGKYINSPETPIYEKSRVLYGLYYAKEAIRAAESVVIVEGYADLISLFQSGIENVVASSGTALTDDQIRLISRYSQNVFLVYDADSAGSKAMMRGVDLIIGQGLDVRVVKLPQGEDPDSFVRKEGPQAFRALLESAMSFLDFKVEQFQAAGLLKTPEGQTRTIRSIVQTIATMQDELKRNLYIKHLSDRYGIYESVLFRELEHQLGTTRRTSPEKKGEEGKTGAMEPETRAESTSLPPAERDLLKVMVEHGPDLINHVLAGLSLTEFDGETSQRVLQFLMNQADEKAVWDPAGLLDTTSDEDLKRVITDLLFNKYEISKGWGERDAAPEEVDPRQIADQCIRLKKQQAIEGLIRANQEMLQGATARGEDRGPFVEKLRDLTKEKHLLKKSLTGS